MDIIDPFSPGKGQTKFILVGVDYFTKWIEAEPLASISAKKRAKLCVEEHCLSIWRPAHDNN